MLVEVREVEKLFNMSSLKIGIQGFKNAVLKIIIKKNKINKNYFLMYES